MSGHVLSTGSGLGRVPGPPLVIIKHLCLFRQSARRHGRKLRQQGSDTISPSYEERPHSFTCGCPFPYRGPPLSGQLCGRDTHVVVGYSHDHLLSGSGISPVRRRPMQTCSLLNRYPSVGRHIFSTRGALPTTKQSWMMDYGREDRVEEAQDRLVSCQV